MNIEQSLTAIESFVVQCRNKKGLKKNACKAKILLMTKNNDSNEKEKIARYIEDRKIKNIVCFTHVTYLERILLVGLLQPELARNKRIRRLFPSKFLSDKHKSLDDKYSRGNLSISYPDYEMFYDSFKDDIENWAVVLFNTEALKKHECKYKSGKDGEWISGFQGLKEMFEGPGGKLGNQKDTWLTANPQTKVEAQSVYSEWIEEIHLSTTKHEKWVKSLSREPNVQVKVNQKFFEPRIGHHFWPSSAFSPRIDNDFWPPSEINQIKVESIHGNDHWGAFISAIEDSNKTLFILSGWISSEVIDDVVLSKLEDAIKRGVKIYLGYGWSFPNEKHKMKTTAKKALAKLRELEKRTAEEEGKLFIKEFKNHTKIIIVDNKYRIAGSNNWLSNKKYSNSEYSIKIFSEIETEEAQKDLAADF